MDRVSIIPENKQHWLTLRLQNGTSTEAAALFNKSPYLTYYEMWHRKKDQILIEIEENDFMKWGSRLEPQIAAGVAEDNGWTIRPKKEFISIPSARIAASFDFEIENTAILEIKNVNSLAFKQGWLEDDDGNLEAPIQIELQVQQQMLVSGLTKAYICALVGGNTVKILQRDYDKEIGALIADKWEIFWKSIDDNIPPDPDFEQDAEFLQALYQNVNQGSSLDARGNDQVRELVLEYKRQAEIAKKAESMKQAAKSELLTIIGDNEKVFGDGFKISAGLIGATQIAYERKSYRDFRVFTSKGE